MFHLPQFYIGVSNNVHLLLQLNGALTKLLFTFYIHVITIGGKWRELWSYRPLRGEETLVLQAKQSKSKLLLNVTLINLTWLFNRARTEQKLSMINFKCIDPSADRLITLSNQPSHNVLIDLRDQKLWESETIK